MTIREWFEFILNIMPAAAILIGLPLLVNHFLREREEEWFHVKRD